jgi:hypothetical protein
VFNAAESVQDASSSFAASDAFYKKTSDSGESSKARLEGLPQSKVGGYSPAYGSGFDRIFKKSRTPNEQK